MPDINPNQSQIGVVGDHARWLSRLRCASPYNQRMNPSGSGDQAFPPARLRRLSPAGYPRHR